MSIPADSNTLAINIQGALPEGAKLLKWRVRVDVVVVFCEWRGEYVSWIYSPGASGVDHGKYNRDYSAALETFRTR